MYAHPLQAHVLVNSSRVPALHYLRTPAASATRESRNAALALFSRLRALFSRLRKLQNNSYIQKKVRLGLRTPRFDAL